MNDEVSPKSNSENVAFRTKSSLLDIERTRFHEQQMGDLTLLMPALDPDPPIDLGELQRFDRWIISTLQSNGYGRVGMASGVPRKAVRLRSLANRLGRGHGLSDEDIETIAQRIGWLQRNEFRWEARDGYEALAASKPRKKRDAKGPKDGVATNAPTGPGGPPASVGPDTMHSFNGRRSERFDAPVERVNTDASSQYESRNIEASADAIRGTDGTSRSLSSTPIDRFTGWPGNPAYWASWSDQVRKAMPTNAPIHPPKPKTFAKTFPVEKAKTFLLAIYLEKSLDDLLTTGRDLLDDREQLHQALTCDERARDEILDAFAKLGLELEP